MSRPNNRKRFKDDKDIVIYTPTGEDVGTAHKRSCKLGAMSGCYAGAMGRMIGFLGEIGVSQFLGARSQYVGGVEYTHDIVYKKQRVEVKSKSCGSRPLPGYIAFANAKKGEFPDNDVYFFTRVRRDYQSIYLCGWLPAPTFFDEAEFIPKGTVDDTGYQHRMDGYHIAIEELNPARAFKKTY